MKQFRLLFIFFSALIAFVFDSSVLSIANNSSDSTITKTYSEFTHPYLDEIISLSNKGAYDPALLKCEMAINEFEKVENYRGVVATLLQAAQINRLVNDFDNALKNLEKAISICNKPFNENKISLAETHYQLGVTYDLIGKGDIALVFHQTALKERIALFGDTHLKVAISYSGLGDVYLYLFKDYYSAETNYLKSIEILDQLQNIAETEYASIYYPLAGVLRLKGDFERALSFYYKVIDIYEKQDNQKGLSNCYNGLGNVYYQRDEYDKAVDCRQKAIYHLNQTKKTENNFPLYYNNLAAIYIKKQPYDSALLLTNLALKHILNLDKLNYWDSLDLAQSYYIQGLAYTKKQSFDSAFLQLQKSLTLRTTLLGHKHFDVANIYLDIGHVFYEKNDFHNAVKQYQLALVSLMKDFDNKNYQANPKFSEEDDLLLLSDILYHKAQSLKRIYKAQDKIDYLIAAVNSYSLFDEASVLHRKSFSREGSKLILAEEYKPYYENAIESTYLLNQLNPKDSIVALAYRFMEHNKSLILWDAVQEAITDKSVLPDSIVVLEKSIKEKLAYYNSELEVKRNQHATTNEISNTQQYILAQEREMEKLYRLISTNYPGYYQVKIAQSEFSLNDLQKFAHDVEGQLIEYLYGDSAIYVLSINDQDIGLKRVNKSIKLEKQLTDYIDFFQQDIDITTFEEDFPVYKSLAFVLYQQLLQPFLKNDKYENLIIVPDGLLSFIPFETFITETYDQADVDYHSLNYLIKSYTIGYAPASNMLLLNENRHSPQENEKMVVFGYASSNLITNIRGTYDEAQSIEKYYKASFFMGQKATENNFKTAGVSADILHLAIHGVADLENPSRSRLIFQNEEDSLEDGNLYQYELFATKLKARLAILSACETGVGKWQQGEGVYNLARGFMYAGCSSLIMSLWKLPDSETAQIMDRFYQEIGQNKNTLTALRNAKIHYIEQTDEISSHPRFWAGLVQVGMSTDSYSSTHSIILYAIIFICILILSTLGIRGCFR